MGLVQYLNAFSLDTVNHDHMEIPLGMKNGYNSELLKRVTTDLNRVLEVDCTKKKRVKCTRSKQRKWLTE